MEWEAGVSRCKLLCTGGINKVLRHTTGNHIQYPVINQNGKEYFKKDVHICMHTHIYESLCCTEEISMLFNQLYTSILKKASGHSQRWSVRPVGRAHSLPRPSRRSTLDRGASAAAGRRAWQRQELAHHCPQTLGQRTPATALMVSAILQWDHPSGSNVRFLSASPRRKVFV